MQGEHVVCQWALTSWLKKPQLKKPRLHNEQRPPFTKCLIFKAAVFPPSERVLISPPFYTPKAQALRTMIFVPKHTGSRAQRLKPKFSGPNSVPHPTVEVEVRPDALGHCPCSHGQAQCPRGAELGPAVLQVTLSGLRTEAKDMQTVMDGEEKTAQRRLRAELRSTHCVRGNHAHPPWVFSLYLKIEKAIRTGRGPDLLSSHLD